VYALLRAAYIEENSSELHLYAETWIGISMKKPPNKDIGIKPPCSDEQAAIASAAVAIRKAICDFCEHRIVGMGLKGLVLGYLKSLSPGMAPTRGSEFPRTLKQHPLDHDRSTESSWGNLICHHVGNTILAYYDSLDAGRPTEHLLARVEWLREIALCPTAFLPYGSVQTGYCLMTLPAIKALEVVHRSMPPVPHAKKI